MNETPLTFSIIVPTRNEATDIASTLQYLIDMEPAAIEILVVDASDDETPDIVRGFEARGVKLISQSARGRSEGRNEGMRMARGDVIILLNADVHLPADFIRRLEPHYRAGAGYVLVQAHVKNGHQLLARYVDAQQRAVYKPDDLEWTEGFSVRRDLALSSGMFPEVRPIPLTAGEDRIFADRLRAVGAKRVYDPTIEVTHLVPASVQGFWRQRVERGEAIPPLFYGHLRMPIGKLFLRTIAKTIYAVLGTITLVNPLRIAWVYSRHSPRGSRDVPGFLFARVLDSVGHVVGEWRGFRKVFLARSG